MTLPIIETERLRFREWRNEDFDWMVKLWADEELTRYIGGQKADWEVWRHMATIVGHWQLRGYGNWVLETKDTNQAIGFCGPWAPMGWPEPEIGYTLLKNHHGKGYATEALTASLRFAYNNLGWSTAISMIDNRNLASQKVAQRVGASFERDGILFGEHPAQIWRHQTPQQLQESLA